MLRLCLLGIGTACAAAFSGMPSLATEQRSLRRPVICCDVPLDRESAWKAPPEWSRPQRNIPVVSPIRQRLRRKKDAATLTDLLALVDKETLYLTEEVSLSSTATTMWSSLQEKLNEKGAGGVFEKASKEVGAAMSALGQAAQASLTGEEAQKSALNTAGDRAKAALIEMERLANSVSEAADEASSEAGGGKKLDEAWRRDALRAINALERAPMALQREIRRQRLRTLKRELQILGLSRRRPESITLAELKAARQARAKEIHPDVMGGAGARGATRRPWGELPASNDDAGGFFGRVARSFFGGGGQQAAGQAAPPSPPAAAAESGGLVSNEEEEPEDAAMVELNAAYDAVYKAMTASIIKA